MKYIIIGSIGLVILAFSNPLLAETREEASKKFGARQSVLDVSLSPDGEKIAFIAPSGPSSESVYVVDLASGSGARRVLYLNDKDAELTYCNWANDLRLVCGAYMISDGVGLNLVGLHIMDRSSGSFDWKLRRSIEIKKAARLDRPF